MGGKDEFKGLGFRVPWFGGWGFRDCILRFGVGGLVMREGRVGSMVWGLGFRVPWFGV